MSAELRNRLTVLLSACAPETLPLSPEKKESRFSANMMRVKYMYMYSNFWQ
jgi:hypothetical protein